MTSRIKDNKGSTSVLVIIMMIVLIVFGLAIFTTSLSNLRLAQKKTNWLSDYYLLEGQTATVLADIHALLDKDYKRGLSLNDIQANLVDAYANSPYTLWIEEGQGRYDFMIYLDVGSQEEHPKHLALVLGVPPHPLGQISKPLFDIVSHEQWQEDFEFYNLPGFDDPITTPPEFNLPNP